MIPMKEPMVREYTFGVLLHPLSIAGRWGNGVLDTTAYGFIDWLAEAGARHWQVLPLGPTGYGDSPYQSLSAFAGNPYLIDPEKLFSSGWLPAEEPPAFPIDRIDYGGIYEWRWPFLRRAFTGFLKHARTAEREELKNFRARSATWIECYALYSALKEHFLGQAWFDWPEPYRRRDDKALREVRKELQKAIDFYVWTQWVFARQWQQLRAYARKRAVSIIGDMPIFVAYDSADVWMHPEYFLLDEGLKPTVVAGVPPDYFSQTGQRWGNPLYRWEQLQAEGFSWWIERVRTMLTLCDQVRIDHFRGFEACWQIPADQPTAVYGQWVKAPGEALLKAMQTTLGTLPIIAEDLGMITPEVEALRDRFELPGMKVLQFAFGGDLKNPFLPHNYPRHCNSLVYTGTHDNDTTLGWYRSLGENERSFLHAYLKRYHLTIKKDYDAPWVLLTLALKSHAKQAIVPLQDLLGLGTESRMNFPSHIEGNWAWRYQPDALDPKLSKRLKELLVATHRAGKDGMS